VKGNCITWNPPRKRELSFFLETLTEVVMLNLVRLRETADYSGHPELAPEKPISGKEAFQKYIDHTLPYLQKSGGDLLFLGGGGKYFIGPQNEQWDIVMMVKQNSLDDFLAFASDEEYLKGIGHRSAAALDTRLLPVISTM